VQIPVSAQRRQIPSSSHCRQSEVEGGAVRRQQFHVHYEADDNLLQLHAITQNGG